MQATIFSIPDEFAKLVAIETTKFTYKLTLEVSKAALASSGAVTLLVRGYRTNPKTSVNLSLFQQAPSLSNVNTTKLLQVIQSKTSTTISRVAQARNSAILSVSVGLKDLVKRFNQGVGYTLVQAGKKGVPVPGNTKASSAEPTNEDRTIQLLSQDLLTYGLTDPAQATQKVYGGSTPLLSVNGVQSPNTAANLTAITSAFLSLGRRVSNVPTSILESYNIADRDIVPVSLELVPEQAAVGNDDFFLMVTALDADGAMVQEEVRLVPHRANVEFETRAQVPPALSVSKLPSGLLSATVTQIDKHATEVVLYVSGLKVKPALVASLSLVQGETRTIAFNSPRADILLFRALSVGASGNSGAFSSFVVDARITGANQEQFVSVDSVYAPSGLRVQVAGLPEGVAVVKLLREVEGIAPEPLTTFMARGNNTNTTFSYLDTGLVANKAYRYLVELVDGKGNEIPNAASHEVVYRPPTRSYASVTVTSPATTAIQDPTTGETRFDVRFSVSYAINKQLEDNVRDLLARQGLIEFYGNDLQRERLKSLLATKVEIRDLQSNDVYFAGFIDGEFSQASTQVGLLKGDSRYRYELTTYVRAPSTLLSSIVASGSSTPHAGKPVPPGFSYVPFNLSHPFGLLTGTNPKKSGDEFVQKFGVDQLGFGDVTDIQSFTLDLKPPTPSIQQVTAAAIGSGAVRVSWSVRGDQEQLSHFVLRRQSVGSGVVDLLGTVHGLNTQNVYRFVDQVRETETGVFQYTVFPVLFDMSVGTSSTSNEVVI